MENKIDIEGYEDVKQEQYELICEEHNCLLVKYFDGSPNRYFRKKQQFPIEFKLDDNFKAVLYENLNILIKNDADELWLGKYNSGRAEQILKAIEKGRELDNGKM